MEIPWKRLTPIERTVVNEIQLRTKKANLDNISRTEAYANYFARHPEIRWSFLASMVSRNAGWNMCDLEGQWMPLGMDKRIRTTLFLTYERANWLIFADAFPQLLVYECSKRNGMPLFHLLQYFSVSTFMQAEWELFWDKGDVNQLVTSLIINEQNLIQKPVIEHPFYKKKVFQSFVFRLQDWLHFSSVIFPTLSGELYGCSVHDFWKVSERIELGKKLGNLLFDPSLHLLFLQFSMKTVHTGSRYDYEQYFIKKPKRNTPFLRAVYPVIAHHRPSSNEWNASKRQLRKWQAPSAEFSKEAITYWYRKKKMQLQLLLQIEQYWKEFHN